MWKWFIVNDFEDLKFRIIKLECKKFLFLEIKMYEYLFNFIIFWIF